MGFFVMKDCMNPGNNGVLVLQTPWSSVHDDPGPVCQLRTTEDDRRGGASPEAAADVQDPTTHRHAPQVQLRQAHPDQAGKVPHQDCARDAQHGVGALFHSWHKLA